MLKVYSPANQATYNPELCTPNIEKVFPLQVCGSFVPNHPTHISRCCSIPLIFNISCCVEPDNVSKYIGY
jgi:hypothetical protein